MKSQKFQQPLPDNYTLSLKKLKEVLQRLRQDPGVSKPSVRL